jgi:hypothetical protein
MNDQRLALLLTVVNLCVLTTVVLLLTFGTDRAAPALGVVRATALELVDADGQVRSRLNVEDSGEVVFRLLDEHGTIRVKLGAGEDGSGLLLIDETTEPAVQLVARRAATPDRPKTTSLMLAGSDGQQKLITP